MPERAERPQQRRSATEGRFRAVLVRGEIGQARELAVSLAGDDASVLLTLDALIGQPGGTGARGRVTEG